MGALAGIAISIAVAVPAIAAPAPRDAVVHSGDVAAARASADAAAVRYPIRDGTGATIAVTVSPACRLVCTDAEPQEVAELIGGLAHGPEVERLTVQLDAPFQIALDCGGRVTACYFPATGRIILSGNDEPARDGAGRELVLAHEYGHHLARSRVSPPPFPSPLLWGTPRWASAESVCRMRRAGRLFPGAGGEHYYEDPGEAFAEAYGRLHFPSPEVEWRWTESLRPDEAALLAIREDALAPWTGRTDLLVAGRAPPRGVLVKQVATPLDGMVRVEGARPRRGFALGLQSPLGELSMARLSAEAGANGVEYTVCGEAHLGVVVRSLRDSSSRYRLRVRRP